MSMTDAELIEHLRGLSKAWLDGKPEGRTEWIAADRLSALSENDKIQTAEIMNLQERVDECEEALRNIVLWAEAYPLDIFPEPDFKRAHELLKAGGMTLDSISASNMRHVVNGVGKIAREALNLKAE